MKVAAARELVSATSTAAKKRSTVENMQTTRIDNNVLYQTASITNLHRPAQLCSYGTTKRLLEVRKYEKLEVGYLTRQTI